MSIVVNYRKFYEDLNRARKARGISWHKVAARAGITASSVSSFVNFYERPNSAAKGLALESFVKLMHWMRKTDITEYTMDEDSIDGDVG